MITLSKIAKEAHVSVSTASKAFSGSGEVNEETRQQIFDVAKRYGCFKKFFNAKYSKFVIAVICPEFESVFYTTCLSHLCRNLEQEGCEVCVAESNFSKEREKALLDYYCQYADVDGIIIISPQVRHYDFCEIPILCLGSVCSDENCAAITCDLSTALGQGIDYLQERAVISIGFIGESLTMGKFCGFKESLAKRGMPFREEYVQIVQQRFEAGGYEAMERFFQKETLPRAIICAYDNMAMGTIRCIKDHGLRVPEDIAVMGMDDNPQSPYLVPPLASIATKTEARCQLAAKSIIQMINGQTIPQTQALQGEFQFRESFRID